MTTKQIRDELLRRILGSKRREDEMTDQFNDGGRAFPGAAQHETTVDIHEGMTLRDWFAGMALASVYVDNPTDCERCAEHAYQLADAMLYERTLTDEERRNR